MNVAVQTRPSIRFRGRSLLALVLAPQPPLENWLTSLADWNQRSPGFFAGRPVILDASAIETTEQGLTELVSFLAEQNVRLMGIEGVNTEWLGVGMPPPIGGGIDASITVKAPVPEILQAPPRPEPVPDPDPEPDAEEELSSDEVPALVLDEPVRSGQTVMFPNGDVTVIGSVASGAEVIAGGSVHVYGTLRGRAIAGATGKSDARIFCGRLEAELIAIDGLYRTAEDIGPEFRNVGIHAWLDDDALRIAALT